MDKTENSISVWISILYRYRRNFVAKKLEKYGALGSAYLLVLTVHYNDGVSQEKIADLLKTDKAAIARAVQKLCSEGYLLRVPDAGDKRKYKLSLSDSARPLVPQIQAAIQEWEQTVLAGVPREAYELLEHYLEHMARNACEISN